MITKCAFCDFQKQTPIDLNLFADWARLPSDAPIEDVILRMTPIQQAMGWADSAGVKVHMGKMHKDLVDGRDPVIILEPDEVAIIDQFDTQKPPV